MGYATQFLKGFFTMVIILSVFSLVMADWYADGMDLKGDKVIWKTQRFYAGSVGSDDELANGYNTPTTNGLTCAWTSIGTTDCSSSYCYANKLTADKLCGINGYAFASSYVYKETGATAAYTWREADWRQVTADDRTFGLAGGSRYTSSTADTSYITYVNCCE